MTEKEKAPPYDYIYLRKDRQEKDRFMRAYHAYCSTSGENSSHGEFLMLLLDVWERRGEMEV